jgi:hypothetical protein
VEHAQQYQSLQSIKVQGLMDGWMDGWGGEVSGEVGRKMRMNKSKQRTEDSFILGIGTLRG